MVTKEDGILLLTIVLPDYDPQKRHVIHPWADFNGLDTRHYPNGTDNMYRLERGHKVFMMTEFLHGLYDRGQGAGLKGLWSKFKANPLLPVASFGHMWMKLSAVQIPDKWTLTVLMLPMVLWGQIAKRRQFLYCSGGMVTHSNTSIKNNFFFQRRFLW